MENKACHWWCASGLGIGAELAEWKSQGYHLLATALLFPANQLSFSGVPVPEAQRAPYHGTICCPVRTIQFLSR